ncbi:MAG: hypothetical protein ACOYOA_12240 [Saprospiraceae bacterium]
MNIVNKYIGCSFISISMVSLILFSFIGLMHNKVEASCVNYGVRYCINSTATFSEENSILLPLQPITENEQNKDNKESKEGSISVEEEVDFLNFHFFSVVLFFTPNIAKEKKLILDEKFIELFHPELLVPPPLS